METHYSCLTEKIVQRRQIINLVAQPPPSLRQLK